MTMTAQGLETLNDILGQFKNGNISQEQAAQSLQQLFEREPVNYQRTPNPADDKHRTPLDPLHPKTVNPMEVDPDTRIS